MTRLALLRHGHTAWNRAGRIQGRTDVPLDAEAEIALGKLALPEDWQTASLWSSPLCRASRTAELVSGRPPHTSDALIEMNWGNWEGQQGAHLKSDPESDYRDIENWGWDYQPPGGESPRDVLRRTLSWAETLNEDALAVCHIGVMRVLLAHASGWNFDGPAPFQIKRNRLYIVEIHPGGWKMIREPIRLQERSKCT